MARENEAQPVNPALVGLTPEQFAAILAAIPKPADDDTLLKKRAEYDAEAMRRALHPEIEFHPGISVYSHPEGDKAHPKEPLKCQVFWVGFPLELETLTTEEAELANQLVSHTAMRGEAKYTVTRTDGTPMQVDVTCDTDNLNQIRKLMIMFPCRDEQRHNLPSMANMLREMLGVLSPKEAELRAEITKLRAELSKASK